MHLQVVHVCIAMLVGKVNFSGHTWFGGFGREKKRLEEIAGTSFIWITHKG